MKKIIKLTVLTLLLMCVLAESKSANSIETEQETVVPVLKTNWQKWIKKHAFPVETSSGIDDFHFLQEMIGDKTIVQLGESSHGVKEFNESKVRIIKYLHEKMGFNIIAFESGLFECYNTNASNLKRDPWKMIESIFSVWRTEEVLKLFEYIINTQETDNPLILAGFDFQMSGDWTSRSKMLREIASIYDIDFAKKLFRTDSLFAVTKKPNNIDVMRKYVEDNQESLKMTYAFLEELIRKNMQDLAIKYKSNSLIPLFAHQTSISMLAYIDFWLDEENEMTLRDKAMADNVDFLKNTIYPNEKIIIWAHNLHIRHHNDELAQSDYNKIKSMGAWLHERYPDDLYTIGLYMYEGQGAYNDKTTYDIISHTPNSLESILHSTGYEACFIDLKNQKIVKGNNWMTTEILTKTWGLFDLKLIPRNQYDGILFIDSISPPKYLK